MKKLVITFMALVLIMGFTACEYKNQSSESKSSPIDSNDTVETVESLQGMCYIDNLVMKNCKLINTTLAFEYSSVEAEITGKIDSVKNPQSGTIRADYIDELIIEKDKVDPEKTKIICGKPSKKCKKELKFLTNLPLKPCACEV